MPNAKHRQDALELANLIVLCKEFNTFPRAGGLFDQDSWFVHFLTNYMIWQEQRAELDRKKNN